LVSDFSEGLETELSPEKKHKKVYSKIDRAWVEPETNVLPNEQELDDMLESNMFGSDKISLKTIDEFLAKNRLDFNFNGENLENYFENLDPKQASNQQPEQIEEDSEEHETSFEANKKNAFKKPSGIQMSNQGAGA
jgi:hypothetical protein